MTMTKIHAAVDMEVQILETMNLIVDFQIAENITAFSDVALVLQSGNRIGGCCVDVAVRPSCIAEIGCRWPLPESSILSGLGAVVIDRLCRIHKEGSAYSIGVGK